MLYGELPASTTQRDEFYGTFLYCPSCGSHFSATRGDYFLMQDDEEIVCECEFEENGTPMFLARERVTVEQVRTDIIPA